MDKHTRNTHSDQLMHLHQQGQKQAFFELVALWKKPMVNFFYHQCRDATLSEDLSQEVFIKVFKTPNYTSQGVFSAWIYRIARHIWIDHYRKQRVKVVSGDMHPHLLEGELAQSAEEQMLDLAQADQVYQALGTLSQEDQEILLLSQVQDLKYQEVALLLDLPLGSIKGKIYRGLKKFVKAYKGAHHGV